MSDRKRKRIFVTKKLKAMPTVNVLIEKIEVSQDGDDQVVEMKFRYTGTENLSAALIETEETGIEIPSHAPPPAK